MRSRCISSLCACFRSFGGVRARRIVGGQLHAHVVLQQFLRNFQIPAVLDVDIGFGVNDLGAVWARSSRPWQCLWSASWNRPCRARNCARSMKRPMRCGEASMARRNCSSALRNSLRFSASLARAQCPSAASSSRHLRGYGFRLVEPAAEEARSLQVILEQIAQSFCDSLDLARQPSRTIGAPSKRIPER